MRKRLILALVAVLAVFMGASAAPAAAQDAALVGCPFAPPQDAYVHLFTGQNCTGSELKIGVASRYGGCFDLTTHGTPPNGWSNLIRSGYNSSGVAIAFWDQFGCNGFQGGTLFAMHNGTARPTLNSLADRKASSYCVSLFATWNSGDTCRWGPP